jgi:asparagine synthase (glutamine-hydrolysing)
MCGIGGILRGKSEGPLDGPLRCLQNALRHRGPDDEGLYLSPDGIAGLIHTRLSILDLSAAGHQPMGRCGHWISFNGEIYNFRALREELLREGETFISETDTEVLLLLYLREGPACVKRLRGMFAFAIWNEATRACFLGRDPFGIKPLYYAVSSRGDFVFASEMKALLATGLIDRRLDLRGVDSFLANGSVTEPLTMLAGVRALEAGHSMTWQDGKFTPHPYFHVDFPVPEDISTHSLKNTREALLDSVHHHFVSDVPVGVFLSGGLDSGAILALAHSLGQRQISTFSLGVENSSEDETRSARRLAEFFGTCHHEMLLTRELARRWIEGFLEALDQPTVDGFNTFCVCKLARDFGHRVVLSGIGGDELFGGYPSFTLAPRLHRIGRLLRFGQSVTAPAAQVWANARRTGHAARLAAYLGSAPTLPNAYRTVRSIFSPSERARIGRALFGEVWTSFESAVNDSSADGSLPPEEGDALSCLEITGYLRNQLLRDADVMSMANGLELRVPFVDTGLFSALRAVPANVRLQPGKKLLRQAAASLPTWHAAGAKRGFGFPFADWLRTTWSDLREGCPIAPGIPLDSWSRQWSLIVLGYWLKRHGFQEKSA